MCCERCAAQYTKSVALKGVAEMQKLSRVEAQRRVAALKEQLRVEAAELARLFGIDDIVLEEEAAKEVQAEVEVVGDQQETDEMQRKFEDALKAAKDDEMMKE
jgi:hypothetical protein